MPVSGMEEMCGGSVRTPRRPAVAPLACCGRLVKGSAGAGGLRSAATFGRSRPTPTRRWGQARGVGDDSPGDAEVTPCTSKYTLIAQGYVAWSGDWAGEEGSMGGFGSGSGPVGGVGYGSDYDPVWVMASQTGRQLTAGIIGRCLVVSMKRGCQWGVTKWKGDMLGGGSWNLELGLVCRWEGRRPRGGGR